MTLQRQVLHISLALLLVLLLTFSTMIMPDQVVLAATLNCDDAVKLLNGWNTPGLDQFERITTFTGDDWRTLFHQDGYVRIGVARWDNQPKKIVVDFDIYIEVRGLGVYRVPFDNFEFTNASGDYASNAVITIRPPDALLEVRIGEVRVRPVTSNVDKVTLSPTFVYLPVGKTAQLTATVFPADAPNKAVRWASNNTKVAMVDSNGLVKAVGIGDAGITVTTEEGNRVDYCDVAVGKRIKLNSIAKPATMFLMVGRSQETELKLKPPNATVTPTFASSNPAIASVDGGGEVTAHSPGIATITVKADGKTQRFSVSVGTIRAIHVMMSRSKGTIRRGRTAQLTATIQPETVSPNTLIWKSSNEKIA